MMPETMDAVYIYKICDQTDWQKFVDTGVFLGSSLDQQDGYIHFSALQNLRATAEKHFPGQLNLMLLEVAVDGLPADSLKWEVSRGGAVFPHLYASLLMDQVHRFWLLAVDGSKHYFPDELNI